MPDLVHSAGAVEQLRAAVAAEARRLPALADPVTAPPAAAFGGLADGGVAASIERLCAGLRADLTAAGARLDGFERALDAGGRSLRATDHRSARALTRRP